jgi:hypothetical protein
LAVKAVAQAEAITTALVPEAEASDFAELGGAALEELVPKAVNKTVILEAARRQAMLGASEVAQNMPSLHEAASAWLEQLRRGELAVRLRVPELESPPPQLESIPRLLAVAIVLAGLVVGSALAAGIETADGAFRSDVAEIALVVYLAATALAAVLAVALLWRLLRPEGRRT